MGADEESRFSDLSRSRDDRPIAAADSDLNELYLQDLESPSGYQINIDTIGALWRDQFAGTWLGIAFVLGGLSMKYGYKPKV